MRLSAVFPSLSDLNGGQSRPRPSLREMLHDWGATTTGTIRWAKETADERQLWADGQTVSAFVRPKIGAPAMSCRGLKLALRMVPLSDSVM